MRSSGEVGGLRKDGRGLMGDGRRDMDMVTSDLGLRIAGRRFWAGFSLCGLGAFLAGSAVRKEMISSSHGPNQPLRAFLPNP